MFRLTLEFISGEVKAFDSTFGFEFDKNSGLITITYLKNGSSDIGIFKADEVKGFYI